MIKQGRFAVLIVSSLSFLVCSGPIYYVTITELRQMSSEAQARHLRVSGDVQCNSIIHIAGARKFNLVQDDQILTVTYESRDSLPDSFREGAQALADGHLDADSVFRASEIQAVAHRLTADLCSPRSGTTLAPRRSPRTCERRWRAFFRTCLSSSKKSCWCRNGRGSPTRDDSRPAANL